MFTLYTTPLSANGRKVLAACKLLQIAPAIRHINVYRGEGQAPAYRAINPSGKIPALVDGTLTLTESNAILQYLSEAHGDFRLSSRDPAERAAIGSWMYWEAAHWQPALIEVLSPSVGHILLPEHVPAPAAPPDWDAASLLPLLNRLETQLKSNAFVTGAELTLADLSVAGMTTYFAATGFPYARYQYIAAWIERLNAMPGWRDTATAPWLPSH